MSEPDVRASARYAGSGRVGLDSAGTRWSIAELAYAQPVGLRFGLGAYYRTHRAIDIEIDAASLPGGASDSGSVVADDRETGVAFGMALTPKLRLGLRLGVSHLELSGRATTSFEGGSTRSTGTAIDATRPSVGIGMIFSPNQRFEVGVVYDSRTRWSGSAASEGEATAYALTAPTHVRMGLTYRPSSVVRFLGQLDWVRWSEVRDGMAGASERPPPGDFSFADSVDARFGLELLIHYGDAGVWNRTALRFGFAYRSRGLLDYTGSDGLERARFPGAGRTTDLALGAAFGRVEVAWIWREPRGVWLFGVRQSF